MLWVRLSDAEAGELERRAQAVGLTASRYVTAAVLEQPETISERRQWVAEVGRAEEVMLTAAEGVERLLVTAGADGGAREEVFEVLAVMREAAESVVAMGRAASRP